MEHRLFIAIEVYDYLESLPRVRRRKLLGHFRRLRDFPKHYSDFQDRDETGRILDVSLCGEVAVYYWTDDADQQVKILKLVSSD